MRILVTNDDGVASEGIHILATALCDEGHDVVVAAPDRDMSGTGASLGRIEADQNIPVQRVSIPGCGAEAYSVAGPPGLCVLAGRLGAFGEPPEVVVSGINAGLNTGRAILHSGTVGAALTAQNFGVCGLAVSLELADVWHWATAARLAVEVLARFDDAPERTVLNLNVPARDDVTGIRWARLASFGAVRTAIADTSGDQLVFELQPTREQPLPDSDAAVVAEGYAALTTLVGVAEAWPPEDRGEDRSLVERVVPGAPVEAVQAIPDASDHRSLRRPHGAPPT